MVFFELVVRLYFMLSLLYLHYIPALYLIQASPKLLLVFDCTLAGGGFSPVLHWQVCQTQDSLDRLESPLKCSITIISFTWSVLDCW